MSKESELQVKQIRLLKSTDAKVKAITSLIKARGVVDDYSDTMGELCQEIIMSAKELLTTLEATDE